MKISAQYEEMMRVDYINQRYSSMRISQEFRELLKEFTADPVSFSVSPFYGFSLEEVFYYLKESHEYYLSSLMPKIENTFSQLVNQFGKDDKNTKLFALALHNYKTRLVNHIENEEQVLFKQVEELLHRSSFNIESNSALNFFLQTHDDHVVLELDVLKNLMLRLNNKLDGNLLFEVLFAQLGTLQRDLKIHSLIEDYVFVPMILERTSN